MNLNVLDSPKYAHKEEALPEQVKEQEDPPKIVEEAQAGIPRSYLHRVS